ncbi:Hypothetical protein NTJ_11724 [Nesidiocoris tenuis]|uniref:Uncharacterized protein n=1 Tax=Nesidiocoris tenuis TaxID=355587 RepID=A0ABN7B3C7_9HEMI|nr:Hypothetical protein NTJ_11724 [Nesidiocoris tenuis]
MLRKCIRINMALWLDQYRPEGASASNLPQSLTLPEAGGVGAGRELTAEGWECQFQYQVSSNRSRAEFKIVTDVVDVDTFFQIRCEIPRQLRRLTDRNRDNDCHD